MIDLNLIQGSDEWNAARVRIYRTGSVAPAMMGKCKHVTRNELLRMKATGTEQEFSDWVQRNILARGHEYEAMARPIAEKIIGEDLYPVTVSDDDSYLLASLDGMTMLGDVIWEHKQLSAETLSIVRAGECPEYHYWQVVQGFVITGAEKCLFMVSDGTEENEAHVWVHRNEQDCALLVASWKQFDADMAAYQPAEVIPAAVAAPQMALPAVAVTVSGSIAIRDNLAAFGDALTAYVERINKKPETDQHFADLEAAVKTLKTAEEALDAAESNALAQAESIDTLRRTVGQYRDLARTNRLVIEKLVKAEKENRRNAIVQAAKDALAAYLTGIDMDRFGAPLMPRIQADFVGVVKGLKTMASIQNTVDTELARMKIFASATADSIAANLKTIAEIGAGYEALFVDRAQLVLKDRDAVSAIVSARVNDHKAAEARRLEAERERIRQEEEAKATAKAKAEAERIAAEERAKLEREAAIANASQRVPIVVDLEVAAEPAPIVHADTGATLKLGEICQRLGFNVTGEFLAQLGFTHIRQEKAAKLYRAADFPRICHAIGRHLNSVAAEYVKVAA